MANGNGKKIEFIGDSPAARSVREQLEMVAVTDAIVLLCGETGTGKEVAAAIIHQLSLRSLEDFVGFNCAAITATLAEAELFGHERGAFTGATAQRIGSFETASRGTLFLDEVGEMPLELQPKFLRVLQEREFQRLGSSRTIRTDARLIAATNQDLEELAGQGKFRWDLFYRLNVFPIWLPPLRDRKTDIPLFAKHFLEDKSEISEEALEALMSYSWPGNVRQLRNTLERALIVAGKRKNILPQDILLGRQQQQNVPSVDVSPATVTLSAGFSLKATMEETEKNYIQRALILTKGNKTAAAELLGLQRGTLMKKLRVNKLQ